MKSIIIIVALLSLVSLSNTTVGIQKSWPKPSDLANHNGNFGDSKVGWACSSSSDPNAPPPPIGSLPSLPNILGLPNLPPLSNIPGLPNLPPLPNIPGLPTLPPLPNIPGLPNLPGLPNHPLQSVLVSQFGELEKCLTRDGSKVAEKCFSQIFSSWAENNFVLDKNCCEIVVNMDKKCNDHLHIMFKSHFFAPLLQYSCHIKHTKKN
ncbi:unnamed protein product [Arabis nemorensis]|uniref:Prolamin-like domain-containing protein n=1 Tax=Arabis nemorensis TaxID=586526 RepID=A0A565BUW7_9BRAS|nr:unnamed protein product [Arabis nemorensis]